MLPGGDSTAAEGRHGVLEHRNKMHDKLNTKAQERKIWRLEQWIRRQDLRSHWLEKFK